MIYSSKAGQKFIFIIISVGVNIRLFEISITGKKFSSFQKFLIVMFFVAIIAYLVAGKLTHCKVFLIAK